LRSSAHTENPRMRRRISFSPTCSLLLPWQASSTGKVRSKAANPAVSRLGRLHTSQIPKALSVNSTVTPPRQHLPASRLRFENGDSELQQNRYLFSSFFQPLPKISKISSAKILAEEISSTFVPRDFKKKKFVVWYTMLRSGTLISKSVTLKVPRRLQRHN